MKFDICVHKPPAYKTQTIPTLDTSDAFRMSFPIVNYFPQVALAGSQSMALVGETSDTTSVPLRHIDYRLTQENLQ